MLSPDDAQVAARDPKLCGLRILLDPPALLQLLRERLGHIELKEIRIRYLRYKPQTNCLASYQLETSLGQIDIYAKAYTTSDVQKLSKAFRPSASLLGPGALHLDEIATGVWIFPNDQTLRYLSILSNDSDCRRMLEKIVPEVTDFSEYSIHRLAYKPERRLVGQLRLAGRPVAVLRFYTPTDFFRASHNAKVLRSGKVLRLAPRLGRSKHRAVTAVQWLEGNSLGDLLAHEDFQLSSIHELGRALAEFHLNQDGKLETKTRQMEADSLNEIAEFAAAICPDLRGQLQQLASELTHYLLRQPMENHCVHGDFYARQILLQPDGVAFLDLDEAYSGDPAADIANFLAHLWRSAPHRVQEVQESLLNGYSSAGGRIDIDHINRYTAASLLRLISEPFRCRERYWPETMQSILRQAQSFLSTPSVGRASPKVEVQDSFGVCNDPLMPFLADAIDPATVSRLFATHLPWPAQLVALRVVRYKPQRRCLIEYDLETAGSNPKIITVVGKARAKGLDKPTFQLQHQLYSSGFDDASEDEISVPEPIALIPPLQMWLQRRAPGIASIDLLAAHSAPQLSSRLARAIFKLHQCRIPPRRSHTIGDELRLLHEKLPLVGQRHLHLRDRLQRLLKRCSSAAESLDNGPTCPIHRDFYHDQVLVDGNRIYLLDLDLFAKGDPALDVGNFIGHLSEYALRKLDNPDALADQEKSVTDHYLELAGEHLRRRIRIYSILTLARHIHINTLFDDRSPFTEPILALAEERLTAIS